jgi:ATP-dependent DNA helicase RecQ
MRMAGRTLDDARQKLRAHFGYPDFRPGQDEIIAAVLEGRDTLAVMPTGGGKSLCYQIPALLVEGLTVVVSPLISLMQDQVDALRRASIRATFINSMLDFREAQERIEKAKHGWYALMYVAPERFESASFAERMNGARIGLLAVDEAHCISEWGHDFRPSYLKLREAREMLGSPQVVALTATATPDVRADIQRQLSMEQPRVIVRGFRRDNLAFRVQRTSAKRDAILRNLAGGEGCAIIYAGTRNTVDELAQFLRQHGIGAEAYHAGLDEQRRKEVQERFMRGDTRVLTATTAFGMGIDKADVRLVIHHDMPGSIEQYYQEAGRAGRDGGDSVCLLLHAQGDRSLPEFFIRQTHPDKATVQNVYAVLHNFAGTQVGQSARGLLPLTTQNIAEQLGRTSEAAVRSALDLLERGGYVRRISASYPQSRLRFLQSPEELRRWLLNAAPDTLAPVMVALLRTAGGEAFYHPVDLDLERVAEKTFLPEDALLAGLRALHDAGFIEYHSGQRASGILLQGERVAVRDLSVDFHHVQQRFAHQMEKLQAMEHYIMGKACRRNLILEYFEDADRQGVCGTCDTCVAPAISAPADEDEDAFEHHHHDILHCAAELGGRFGRMTVVDVLRGSRSRRIEQYGLGTATTYGKAAQVEKNTLLSVMDTLIGLGWLERTEGSYPALHITALGRSKIGYEVVPLSLPQSARADGEVVSDPVLYEALRAARRRAATMQNVPSHALASDALLRRITEALPRDEDAMLAIEGMGPVLYRKCGKQMLRAVREHMEQLNLAAALERSTVSLLELPAPLRQTFDCYAQGLSLAEIAERRGMTDGTVSNHIADLILRGVRIHLDTLLPPAHSDAIRKAAAALKKADLKRIKAVTGDEITYAEIRLVLAAMKQETALAKQ